MQEDLFGRVEVTVVPGKGPACRHPYWAIEDAPETSAAGTGLFEVAAEAGGVRRYGSGASAKWDFLGYRLAKAPAGVTATKLNAEVIELVRRYVSEGGKVFVDSGEFGAKGRGELLDYEAEVFPVYEALLAGTVESGNLLMVMPDRIGDAAGTLALQREHANRIRGWIDRGVEAMFPAHARGAEALAWHANVSELLQGREFVVGIPSNQCAWSMQETVAFAAALKPRRMHLLGLGKKEAVGALAARIAMVSPSTVLSCDSCQILAHVGVGRRLTDRQQTRLEAGISEVLGASALESPVPSLGEYLYDVTYTEGFLSAKEARQLATSLGYGTKEWIRRFAEGARTGMCEVFAALDPDEAWLDDVLRGVVARDLYEPQVRKWLAGPVRAYEVARLVLGDDPEWVAVKRRMDAVGWPAAMEVDLVGV